MSISGAQKNQQGLSHITEKIKVREPETGILRVRGDEKRPA
jgi:hypothetical protein